MFEMNWFDFVIVILAAFRITHLIVFDEIAAIIRRPFISIIESVDQDGNQDVVIEARGKGVRHFIGSLLSCYWCTGFWVSVTTVLVYFFIPVLYPVLVVFAVAGGAAIIESKV